MCRQVEPKLPGPADLAIVMLIKVLDGATCAEVGQTYGMPRTTVERRIKALARRLNQMAKIEGLPDQDTASVRRLRAHRQAILDALDVVGPARLAPPGKRHAPKIYSSEQILAAAEQIDARSSQPLRDAALFLLLHTSDVRPLEVARLQVRDYLQANGEVRHTSELRAELAFNGIARPLCFSSSALNEALQRYLRTRIPEVFLPDDGNRPILAFEQPLFLADDGNGFAITEYPYRGQHRYLCRPILETYRKILRHSGLPDGAFPMIRSTTTVHLYAHAAEEE